MRYHLIRKGYAYGDRKLSDCADRYSPVRFYRDSHIKPRYLCIVAIFLFVTLGVYPTADTEQEQQQQKDTLSPDSSLQLASVEDFHAVEINKDTVSPEELSQSVALHTELELFLTPVEQEDLQKYLEEFQSNFGVKWLTNTLEAGAPYRPYIRQKLQEAGLPMALEYLPVIESEYKTTAKSRSGALGMWQFMENSIDGLLMKNDWVDERLDPWKSTDAAIKKLQDNYNWFQDWSLALAAYNAGAGAINRLLVRYDMKNYWELAESNKLSTQTELYVPKFLAVAELVLNEEQYGLTFPKVTAEDAVQWDEVVTEKSVSLNALAQAMNLDLSILEFLNPALLRGRTPPLTRYAIRVPRGTKEEAEEVMKTLKVPSREETYTVVKGDTLWGISRRFGVTVDDICDANNIKENAILSIGKVLYIPIIE